MTAVDFKEDFYARYYATHVAPRKGEASLRSFRESFPNFRKKYRSLLPAELDTSIVELGCGDGRFVYWLNELGYRRVTGSDLSPELVDVANRLGIANVAVGDLLEFLANTNGVVDVLVLRDVLEHFDRARALEILELCRRALKPGGRLILHLPNADSPFFGRIRYGDFTHEMAYSMSSLAQLFSVLDFVDHRFVSDESAVASIRGVPRFICWKITEAIYKFMLTSEVGFSRKIVTQNLIAAADKPLRDR